ncbi:hypothetical protein C8R42DRAFT_718807 [Lentinula raphanica]|nr:hypothetical protein C8R42DRAFT_718807 [Lentinula raphanica]
MARRSRRALRALHTFRRSRPTSRADGPGYLYAYVDRGHFWKVGMTNNFSRRQEEWDKWCPSLDRIWMPPVESRWYISFWRSGVATDREFDVCDAAGTISKSSDFPRNGHSYGRRLFPRCSLGLLWSEWDIYYRRHVLND